MHKQHLDRVSLDGTAEQVETDGDAGGTERLDKVRVQRLAILGEQLNALPILDVEVVGRGDFGTSAFGEVSGVNKRPACSRQLLDWRAQRWPRKRTIA